MKRVVLFILVFVVAAFIQACGDSTTINDENTVIPGGAAEEEKAFGGAAAEGTAAGGAEVAEGAEGGGEASGKEMSGEPASGATEYVSEKYGFAFKYEKLMLNDTIDGDRFIELMHMSGDKAYLTISKPEFLKEGENPEVALKDYFKGTDFKVLDRKELKLSKYKAVLVSYNSTVMGKEFRFKELKAYKDGYYYTLAAVMDEQFADDVEKEFKVVFDSFRLLNNTVDLEAAAPWKEAIPEDYPYDLLMPYKVGEIYNVLGEAYTGSNLLVTYDVMEEVPYEEVREYFRSKMEGWEGFEYDPGVEDTKINGNNDGHQFAVTIRRYELLDQVRVSIDMNLIR
ncbi:MAG: hypothetical protein HGA22_01395 [Clostridiales bacterium]|nr:hypothetical protein [Clostridiales bacterium]